MQCHIASNPQNDATIIFIFFGLDFSGAWEFIALCINIHHFFGGSKPDAATLQGIGGTVSVVASLGAVPLTAWLSGRFGERTTLIAACAFVCAGKRVSWCLVQPGEALATLWLFSLHWPKQSLSLISGSIDSGRYICDTLTIAFQPGKDVR